MTTDDASAPSSYVAPVKRDDAIDELPSTYAVALRLHEAGASNRVVAVALGTEPETVPTILELARRKLTLLVSGDQTVPTWRSNP